MANHKLSLSGQGDIEGKFKNGERVVYIVEGLVKAEPHFVATASGGNISKMSVQIMDVMEPGSAEKNKMLEVFAKRRADREDDGQDSML